MDNPVSWFVLLCLAIFAGVWFVKQVFEEKEKRNNYEWDDKW